MKKSVLYLLVAGILAISATSYALFPAGGGRAKTRSGPSVGQYDDTIQASGDDGKWSFYTESCVPSTEQGCWDTGHDATAAGAINIVTPSVNPTAESGGAPYVDLVRVFFVFDTSGIPDAATVTGWTLYITCNAANDAGGDIYVLKPPGPLGFDVNDWDEAIGGSQAATEVSISTMTCDGTDHAVSFTGTDMSAINLTGDTELVMVDGFDFTDTPTGGFIDRIAIETYDHDVVECARLVVDYTY